MKGVAVVGASERTLWTYWMVHNLQQYGYGAQIWPVNPNRPEVFGLPCYPTLDDIPGVPEIGVIVVRPELASAAGRKLIELGARTVIVVSNGFRESGTPEGIAAEEELVKICGAADARLIGPNCVGFASLHDGMCAIAEPVPQAMKPGSVTVTSHSGAMVSGVLGALDNEGLGIDQCFSIGNGASFGMAASLAAGVDAPNTRVICAVVEGIPQREVLEETVRRGHEAGKEFVFLLLGQSAGGRKVAQSHTGAVIGEGRVARAWLRRIGVTVTTSVEELARTATLVGYMGRPTPGKGLFVMTASGGSAGLASDLAEKHGVPLAQVSEETTEKMRAALPAGAYPGNPLDMVAGIDPAKRDELMAAVCSDPSVGVLLEPYTITWPDDSVGRSWHRAGFEEFARHSRQFGTPGVVSSIFEGPLSPWIREYHDRTGLVVTPGLNTTMAALGRLYGSEGPVRSAASSDGGGVSGATSSVIGEEAGRDLIIAAGLPVVPGRLVADVAGAAAEAAASPGPWVLKLGLPGVAHKGRVGGVKVNLWGEAAVTAAGQEIAHSAVRAGLADRPEDVPFLMQEMHSGPEILLGAVRDEIAGPSLTVSLGGWAAEAATPFGVLTLPMSADEVASEVRRWGLGRLLGSDREAQLIEFTSGLAAQFAGSGAIGSYTVVEINPLILGPKGPVAADVLLIQ
jgi:acyl-CoA synthetase (NDP forming)